MTPTTLLPVALALLLAASCRAEPPAVLSATAQAARTSCLHDEAEVFGAAQRSRLENRVRKLRDGTGCEVYVYTRVVGSFEGFETACDAIFRNVVKDAGHYKIVLVVLGYQGTVKPGTGRGKVYTALGAGLMHVLTKQKLESLLSRGGQKLGTETILAGIDDLAATLESYFKRAHSVAAEVPRTLAVETAETGDPRLRTDLLAGIGCVVLLGFVARRMTRCPQCGARLRKQVKILPAGAEGGSHAVRRTAKCFNCGYVRRGAFF